MFRRFNMFSYENQVAIVTGSGSKRGIGRSTAIALSRLGAIVVVADLNEEGVRETVTAIESENGKALGIILNVTDEGSVQKMVDLVLNTYGRIDVLINNAGISQRLGVEDMKVEDLKKIFKVNIIGVFLCSKAVLTPMKKQKYGRIVSVSSVAGKRGGGFFGGAHYSASKAAVLGFSKNLAREVAKEGITVNCVAPGLVNTDIWESLPKDVADDIVATIPMGRPGETNEVASTIAFLASKEASYITGEDIDINGGSHMD